jgi:hypothetical protein
MALPQKYFSQIGLSLMTRDALAAGHLDDGRIKPVMA